MSKLTAVVTATTILALGLGVYNTVVLPLPSNEQKRISEHIQKIRTLEERNIKIEQSWRERQTAILERQESVLIRLLGKASENQNVAAELTWMKRELQRLRRAAKEPSASDYPTSSGAMVIPSSTADLDSGLSNLHCTMDDN